MPRPPTEDRRPFPQSRSSGHFSGKLVVVAMIGLGLVLGVIALRYRKLMPKSPATQPTSAPVSGADASPSSA